jgi:hypothetical protein
VQNALTHETSRNRKMIVSGLCETVKRLEREEEEEGRGWGTDKAK